VWLDLMLGGFARSQQHYRRKRRLSGPILQTEHNSDLIERLGVLATVEIRSWQETAGRSQL